MNLTEQDKLAIRSIANEYGIHPAKIYAVIEVETSGGAYIPDPDGRPKILFEQHIFWKRLSAHGLNPADYKVGNEDILNIKPGGYVRGAGEFERLERAVAIHREAALESASWGLFQIMGFNYRFMKFESVHEFIMTMGSASEPTIPEQVRNFFKLISGDWNRLGSALPEFSAIDALRRHDATFMVTSNGITVPRRGAEVFAWKYNGADYRLNKYDEKIDVSYAHYLAHEP